MNNRLFLDIHAIQTLPPSNINRDDTGSPKTAQYGGVTRARVSSQSWKKAIRLYFMQHEYGEVYSGKRTRQIVKYIADEIRLLDDSLDEEKALSLANQIINDAGVTTKDFKAKALFFVSSEQAKALAKKALEGNYKTKELKTLLNDKPSVDMALFGRMVADDPSLNEDASCQVAHAVSTHAVQTEFDFYTATDDLQEADNAGAGMLGTIEFNSSTLYRYANVAIHELKKQLENADFTVAAVQAFVDAFVKSMPTGHINSFANQTLPSAVVVTLRSDRPVNLVTAFEDPVQPSDGYVDGSVKKLRKEFESVLKFVDAPLCTLTIGVNDLGDEQNTFQELIKRLSTEIAQALQ